MRVRFFLSLLIPVLFIFSSWGFLVHRTVNQLAVYELPKGLQALFYSEKDYLVYNAPRPDIRRNTDKAEGNKHFIDMEYYGSSAYDSIPHNWQSAVAKYSADTLRKYGTVPFVIIENLEKLTNAFRARNRDSILYYAADLGHYIGDAHVPLHTSLNYDGQLTGQNGLHDLWETTVPELELSHYQLSSCRTAQYIKDPQEYIWNVLKHTHSLLPGVFAMEREVSKKFTDSTKYRWQVRWGKNRRFYSTAFAAAYSKALKGSINDQLIRSANTLADFWYTAWVNAGRPDIASLTAKTYSPRAFRKERRAFRWNRLVHKKLLLSLRNPTNE